MLASQDDCQNPYHPGVCNYYNSPLRFNVHVVIDQSIYNTVNLTKPYRPKGLFIDPTTLAVLDQILSPTFKTENTLKLS
jgi:hypothetical protein